MHPSPEHIAVVGIGCRFPGADGPESLWRLLCDSRDAITEIPPSRFDIDAVYHPAPGAPGKMVTRWGGLLSSAHEFDTAFFGISPREAVRMDPQQRLLLEVAWEALEDAGVVVDRLPDRRVGVYVGLCNTDFWTLQCGHPSSLDVYVNVGSSPSVAAGRISYCLGFEGPSLAVNTACSSSMVAIHLACQSLRAGETTLALAGGVNLVLTPEVSISFSQAGMLSPDGRCKSFDARANGFVRSDGVGVVVLKPLSRAMADGDRVYAVILGSAVNNDGRSGDLLMTPSRPGQEAVLRAAYADAGVDPASVRYVEAHGTGTRVGDPVEVGALAAVLGAHRTRALAIGSLKSNIGHTEAAAGVAGLIKVALALQRRTLPPSLHVDTPNPEIPWEAISIGVQRKLEEIPAVEGPLVAGVSSFGIAGTNGHLVVGEAPPCPGEEVAPAGEQLLALSAQTAEGLAALVRAYRTALPAGTLSDLAFTAAVRRTHHAHRAAFVAGSREQLEERLAAFAPAPRPEAAGAPDVVWVFAGQGSQWPAMGRTLLDEPPFRDAIERCATAMRPHIDWPLLQALSDEEFPRRDAVDVVQPSIFAMQVALGSLWRSWGVEPRAIIGQSMGEVAAAHLAGILSIDDAARIICRRSRLLSRVSGRGAMAVVGLPMEAVRQLLVPSVSIAISNSPGSTVLSGDLAALLELQQRCEQENLLFRLIRVDVASHSPQMDPLLPDLRLELSGIEPSAAQVPLHSTVTGAPVDGRQMDAEYWVRNLREPVLFSDALAPLLRLDHPLFIELSPHPLLAAPIQQSIVESGRPARVLPSLRRDEHGRAVMLESLGALYEEGADVDWRRLFPRGGRHRSLPSYPWQRESFPVGQERSPRAETRHPLLQRARVLPHPQTWELTLDGEELSWLAEHRIHGTALAPAALFVELALAAAAEALGPGPHQLQEVVLREALFLGEAPELRLVLDEAQRFQIASRDGAQWRLHAEGTVTRAEPAPPAIPLADVRGRSSESLDAEQHYRQLAERGLDYGPSFRGVEAIWRRDGEALGRVRLPEGGGSAALLDACFQVLFAALPRPRHVDADGWLPVALERFARHGEPAGALFSHAVVREPSGSGQLTGDIVVCDESGQPVAEARGLGLQRFDRRASRLSDDLLYEPRWDAAPLPIDSGKPHGCWLLLADESGAGARLAALLSQRGETTLVATRRDLDPQAAPAVLLAWLRGRLPAGAALRGVVHLWALDAAAPEHTTLSTLGDAQRLAAASLLAWIQALAELSPPPRLWTVTSGVHGEVGRPVSIAQAPVWGLAKTAGYELPALGCTAVDIGNPDDLPSLAAELLADSPEREVALRDGRRHVLRLARSRFAPPPERALTRDMEFRVETAAAGMLDTLRLRPLGAAPPAPGEVRIRVHCVSLNFIDVMRALGVYPGQAKEATPLGVECAGTVEALGEGVGGWRIGDEVLAVTPAATACLASTVCVPAALVARRPAHLDPEQAVTLPMALLTAEWALHHLGRLAPGERVLIHSASGGVGLAAVQLARRSGAEIFATAGSDEKRQYLRSIGVEHVFDSRTTAFADSILEATGGRGVDVVLNSLTGDAARRSLELLAPFGRFLELGKRDIHDNQALGLRALRDNRSYLTVDIDQLLRLKPERAGALLTRLVGDADLTPLPSQLFPVAQVAEAFRLMTQARHIGRVVVSLRDLSGARLAADVPVSAQACYLITGGLGGLGLAVAGWLVQAGARELLLVGRNPPGPAAEAALARLRSSGARVEVAQADVARAEELAPLLAGRPLRGIVHCAGVLDDGILLRLTPERLQSVAAPKIAGAWNLHSLTQDLPLDFFVLFSSAASLFGSPGQGNYVAANSFLDALARHRRALGLSGLSINWGPWAEVGLAARAAEEGRLVHGFGALDPEAGAAAFGKLLRHPTAQVGVVDFDLGRWEARHAAAAGRPFFSLLRERSRPAADQPGRLTRDALLGAEAGERTALVQKYLVGQVARVVGRSAAQLDPRVSLRRMGLDSLMAVELKNRLEADLGVVMPVVKLLQGPDLALLAVSVCELAEKGAPRPSLPSLKAPPVAVERLSDREVDALLTTLLADREAGR